MFVSLIQSEMIEVKILERERERKTLNTRGSHRSLIWLRTLFMFQHPFLLSSRLNLTVFSSLFLKCKQRNAPDIA